MSVSRNRNLNRPSGPPAQVAKICLTPEMDDMLKRIHDSKNVAGIMLINREGITVKTSLDSSVTAQYSGLISYFAERAKTIVKAMDPTNELMYLRVTSKKHEILVAPDTDFVLIVMQNPPDPNA